MNALDKSFFALTAGDLMSRPVVVLHQDTALSAAARLLRDTQVSGAPVVDAEGRCVGVLSAADFVRWTERIRKHLPESHEIRTCSFVEGNRCTLPVGACPVQEVRKSEEGKEINLCRMPHCVLVDWQVVLDALPVEPPVERTMTVSRYMTADPVMVASDKPIAEVAQMMVDAHIHRIIVVDGEQRPIGIVSGTDVLAAVARQHARQEMRGQGKPILFPTDLEETSDSAFALACSEARKEGSRLIVLHVYPPPICHGEVVARRQPVSYEDDLWRLLERYQAADLPVEHRLTEGDATTEILRTAEEEGCSLVVMGTQGRSGLARLILGSVAEKVLRQAPCPVLTIRPSPFCEMKQPAEQVETVAHV